MSRPGAPQRDMTGIIARFIKHSSISESLHRVNGMNFRCQEIAPDMIDDLAGDNWKYVYLVYVDLLNEPSVWSDTRRRLTMANRLFVGISSDRNTAQVVRFMKDGAFEVVGEKESDGRWVEAIGAAASSQKLWLQVYGGQASGDQEILVGQSPEMVSLRQNIRRLGPTDATVLIMGESGAGKERVAEALHKASGSKEIVAVNCAAIPRDLIEAELFGSEKGAYTGAQARKGLVEQADNGTLFLDEIGELDLSLQPKLLRFLETRTFRRVGGNRDIPVSLRVIAATNRELDREIARGRFRGDLYFRLSEIILKIAPLRLRKSDLPIFARLFMERANARFGKNFEMIEPELLRKFTQYDWPGNVREFKSSLDRLVLMNFGTTLRACWWDLPSSHMRNLHESSLPFPSEAASLDGLNGPYPGEGHSGINPYNSPRPYPPVYAPAHPHPHPSGDFPSAPQGHFPSQKERLARAHELLRQGESNLSVISAQLGIHPTTLYRWRKQGKV